MPKAKNSNATEETAVAEADSEEEEEIEETEEGEGETEEKPEKPEKKEIQVIAEDKPKKKQLVVYPEYRISHRSTASDKGGLTETEAMTLLGWRSEKEAIAIVMAKNPKLKADDLGYGDDFLFKDANDEKVRCLANKFNRPHDGETSHKYCQDILSGNWAGPLMLPEVKEEVYGGAKPYTMADGTVVNPGDTISVVNGTVNGETIVIGRYGNIISGQHRLIGFVWACQLWRKESERYAKVWPDQPVLECVVVTGCSEDPRVVRTIDNVKPRQFRDVIYTSPIFADLKSTDKKECSAMAEKAINFVWSRTIPDALEIYQTHSESMNFLERHGGPKGRMMQGVRATFVLDKEHHLGELGLNRGQSVALLYLMGCSATDGNKYRGGSPPSEKLCDWSREKIASDFWQKLVKNVADEGQDPYALEAALKAIVDVSGEKSARWSEKLVVLSRAWQHVVEGGDLYKVDDEDTLDKISLKDEPDYVQGEDGKPPRLVAKSHFGGIDLGSKQPKEEDPEKIESEKQKTRQEKEKAIQDAAEKHNAKVRAKKEGNEETPKSPVLAGQRETRKVVEQQQRDRAADADFEKMWGEWADEGKLVATGSETYKRCLAEWVKGKRPDITEFLANLVRDGDAAPNGQPKTPQVQKPAGTKIKVKGSLKPGNASR